MPEKNIPKLAPPKFTARLTNEQILLGPQHDPLKIITTYNGDEWEAFILEWACSLFTRYQDVRRAGNSGDKGRDIVAYEKSLNSGGPWDNYQCKHYDHPLAPSDIWKELAKLCYYTFQKEYSVPRAYYFVAPQGVGPKVLTLFEDPEKLKDGLVKEWGGGDLFKVGKSYVRLEAELKQHVEEFDFSIVRDLPPHKIITQHKETSYYVARFGGGLSRLPPDVVQPPAQITEGETRYVQQLLEAYGDSISQRLAQIGDLSSHPKLHTHFHRQRTHFYLAEELRNFTRDNLPEEGCFERLQTEILDGVIDISESLHQNGFERLKKTIEGARNLQIDSHPLKSCLQTNHRSGICHQLANNDKLTWVP
jgi:hypothetical protein